jgi:hypothetical protein
MFWCFSKLAPIDLAVFNKLAALKWTKSLKHIKMPDCNVTEKQKFVI